MATAALAIATATALSSGAQAASIDVTSVVGTWQNVIPAGTQGLSNTYDGVTNTAQLRWGNPSPSTGDPSGYDFKGVAPPPAVGLTENMPFVLGDFTHFNFPISALPAPPSITSAQLSLSIDFTFMGSSRNLVSVFDFVHNETNNADDPCANDEPNGEGVNEFGCADSVTVSNNLAQSESFRFGDELLTFEVTGFDIGNGSDVFWTAENQPNSAPLQGKFTISPVPLPAAGWMLLAGIGGLAAMRRRKKA